MKEWLKKTGFQVGKHLSVSYLRADFLKRVLPLPTMRALEHLLQFVLSWAAYSPSIFLRSSAVNQVDPAGESVFFRCPACGHYPLSDTPPVLICDQCDKKYHLKDGIYDFRLDK